MGINQPHMAAGIVKRRFKLPVDLRQPLRRDPHAVIPHAEKEAVPLPPGSQKQRAQAAFGLQTVENRIFHQRLEQHLDHLERKRFLREMADYLKLILKPAFLDVQVRFHHAQLLPQRHEGIALCAVAENTADIQRQLGDFRGVALHRHAPHHLQRVVEKVRIHLAAQVGNFGLLLLDFGLIELEGGLEDLPVEPLDVVHHVCEFLSHRRDLPASAELDGSRNPARLCGAHALDHAEQLVQRRHQIARKQQEQKQRISAQQKHARPYGDGDALQVPPRHTLIQSADQAAIHLVKRRHVQGIASHGGGAALRGESGLPQGVGQIRQAVEGVQHLVVPAQDIVASHLVFLLVIGEDGDGAHGQDGGSHLAPVEQDGRAENEEILFREIGQAAEIRALDAQKGRLGAGQRLAEAVQCFGCIKVGVMYGIAHQGDRIDLGV